MFKNSVILCLTGAVFFGASDSVKSSDVLKYIDLSQKKGYQNEAQDRTIKKRSYKSVGVGTQNPISNKEIGLFAQITPEQCNDDAQLKSLLANESVNGLSLILPWQNIEPEEGKYNWGTIDHLLELAKAADKSLILRISSYGLTDSDTPGWVYSAGAKSVQYERVDGRTSMLPIFWDPVYLAKWANTISALGSRYDKNPTIHSVGITGGGMLGGTRVIPTAKEKSVYAKLEKDLQSLGMSQRQLVQHWKYVADIFPRAFPNTRLNFDIDPPTPDRAGQDSLDEITDYLVYRYGERVYLTRLNVDDPKHGFDQYRVILKFKPDTLTGYQITKVNAAILRQLSKNALDDGISYVELPSSYFTEPDPATIAVLNDLRSHLGFQLVSEKISLPNNLKVGEKLPVSFVFVNKGSAPAMRPVRELDKDVASSYRIQVELRDSSGKPVVIIYHTPNIPTNKWLSGKSIEWSEDLKMPSLKPGAYKVYVSVVDSDNKRKLQFLDASTEQAKAEDVVAVGQLQIVE